MKGDEALDCVNNICCIFVIISKEVCGDLEPQSLEEAIFGERGLLQLLALITSIQKLPLTDIAGTVVRVVFAL